MKLLEGKNALITGASRGIGKAIAIAFAKEGANIAFTDIRRDEIMEQTEQELLALGVKALGYASDAGSFDDSEKTVDLIAKEFGRIDILVNNAGITRDNLLMRMPESDWDLVLKVNLKSAFNLTKAVQKYMLKQRSGSIINMSSVVGVNGNGGQSNYSASKAGLIGFTKSIAQELGSRNIRCNAIAPGYIETEMTARLTDEVRKQWEQQIPLRRGGKPEDVAAACIFFASDLSAYVTGQVLNVCGGMST
jgi:3-oxoacyl-[acyl-carrier protein] reductase